MKLTACRICNKSKKYSRSEQRFTKLTKPSGSLAEMRITFYDFIVIKNKSNKYNTRDL